MRTRRFPLIGGRAMRYTRTDLCGRPAYGDRAHVTTEGYVSVAVTANYEDGEEVSVTNAGGRKCVSRAAEPELVSLSLDITFCDVDPDLYTAVTGHPKLLDPVTGDVIGFRVNRGVRPGQVRGALEVWSEAQGSVGCEGEEDVPWGYLLWPYLSGARVGDYTIENGAVTFSATGLITRDGSQWGVGPYLVVEDEDGEADFLSEPVDVLDHQWVLRTLIAPPMPTDGLVPLDAPGPDATVATAGVPGRWNGVRPYDLTELQTQAVTASPATAWTTGQSVILGNGAHAHWDGSAWDAGRA